MSTYYQSDGRPRWAAEPFRLFFPLGIIAGVAGVMMWPLFFWHMSEIWPGVAHPRLMIGGFGGAFITGFLGTAWPRFLGSRPLRTPEVLVLATLWLAACKSWFGAELAIGDFLMALELTTLLLFLLLRVHPAAGLPPPGFLLAFLSVAGAAAVLFWWAVQPVPPTPWSFCFTRLIFHQGFLLLPLMGVGSYLFPRFFSGGPANRSTGQDSNGNGAVRPPFSVISSGRRKAGVFLPAAMVIGSFAWEASGNVTESNLMRSLAVAVWVWLAVPVVLVSRIRSTRAMALRVALVTVFGSFIARAAWPQWPVGMEHALFLAGFGLALLLVADRVSLGHNDLLENTPARSVFWRWTLGLVIVTAATRVTADVVPAVTMSHYIYAALLWAAILPAWWFFHRRFAGGKPSPGISRIPRRIPLPGHRLHPISAHEHRT